MPRRAAAGPLQTWPESWTRDTSVQGSACSAARARPARQDAHVAGERTQAVGLPDGIGACLFDLDGVLTKTAKVHAAAWKEMFDTYLRARSKRTGEEYVEFDAHHDYDRYVDGLPRYDGVRMFLQSRGIELPEGDPSDPPGAETVCGLGNLKNELVLKLI